jgi:saccharopine dehydrogenase (NADP+, L-glutamate forming)
MSNSSQVQHSRGANSDSWLAGFPEFVKVLVDIGFLSEEEQNFLKEPIAWKEATRKILGASSSSENDLLWAISSKTTFKNTDEKNQLMAGLKWRK